jgi:chitin synthase
MPPTEHEIASGRKLPPLQLTFALKEHNAGKLNSHLWYFRAFCHAVAPTYCLLLVWYDY